MCNTAITEKEIKVLGAIVGYMKENEISPTVRELQTILGYGSTSTVHSSLQKLSDAGAISYQPTKPRTIVFHGFYD